MDFNTKYTDVCKRYVKHKYYSSLKTKISPYPYSISFIDIIQQWFSIFIPLNKQWQSPNHKAAKHSSRSFQDTFAFQVFLEIKLFIWTPFDLEFYFWFPWISLQKFKRIVSRLVDFIARVNLIIITAVCPWSSFRVIILYPPWWPNWTGSGIPWLTRGSHWWVRFATGPSLTSGPGPLWEIHVMVPG